MARASPPLIGARRRWALVAAVALAILVGSLVPLRSGGARGPALADEAAHVVGYAALGLALAHATAGDPDRIRRAAVVVLAATAYGVAMEVLQIPVPGRTFAAADVLADAVGAAVAAAWLLIEPHLGSPRGRDPD